METVTLASLYEQQGLRDDAIEIYKKVLSKEPHNKDAKIALNRLLGVRKEFDGVNIQMKDFFIEMQNRVEFKEFERWLIKIWK